LGLGVGVWGLGVGVLGIGPKPQSPIPKSPIPNPQRRKNIKVKMNFNKINIKLIYKWIKNY